MLVIYDLLLLLNACLACGVYILKVVTVHESVCLLVFKWLNFINFTTLIVLQLINNALDGLFMSVSYFLISIQAYISCKSLMYVYYIYPW